MANNDASRSRKTYSFFRSQPVETNKLSTQLNAGNGLNVVGTADNITYSIDTTVLPTISSSNTFTNTNTFSGGLSGSLQQTPGGLPYLLAGRGIKLTSQSNGQILIASTTGSLHAGSGSTFNVPNNEMYVITSGSVDHVTYSLSDHPHNWQEHFFKDGDGNSPTFNIIISASAGMRIDDASGTEITSSYGVRGVVFTGNNLWNVISSR